MPEFHHEGERAVAAAAASMVPYLVYHQLLNAAMTKEVGVEVMINPLSIDIGRYNSTLPLGRHRKNGTRLEWGVLLKGRHDR